MKKQTIIISLIIILTISIIGASLYFYKKPSRIEDTPKTLVGENENLSEEKTVIKSSENTENPKLDISIANKNISFDVLPKSPVPDLKSPVKFTIEYPADIEKSISDQIEKVRAELRGEPNNFSNWIDLGLQMKAAGEYEKAKEAWEYASLLRPSNTLSFNNLGDLYHYYLKDYKKAEGNLLTSIKNNPNYAFAYRNLFDLYHYSYEQNTDKAEKILLSGIVILPDNTDLIIPLAMYYKEKGDRTSAEKYYNLAIKSAESKNNTKLAELLKQDLQSL